MVRVLLTTQSLALLERAVADVVVVAVVAVVAAVASQVFDVPQPASFGANDSA